MRGLKKYFKDFVTERSIDISARICCFNGEYRKLDLKINEMQEEINQKMPEDMQQLFIKLEELETAQQAIIQDGLYKQGLLDGIRIARTIEQLGREALCK
ncbi:DUF6809 family protein [Ruminiclostridium papyrosolvens]|uniref:Uncharacterized protein n=1 Tax=Ruminiclostridium papyrosolvens C7 TaxID=1330534 RepID=U4QWZ7_9FIRM|nr:DUF6809 family protein [Ruminiclostridium papyrosolvens]EPR08081.1 hypothetical protein L323_18245 [Ruminiclostridium papyrosolvens C7]